MKNFITSLTVGAFLIAQTLSFCALSATVSHGIAVSEAWVRATVPGQTASGGFMRISSKEAATLTGFTTNLAKTHQLHDMSMDGDVMRMRELRQVSLSAGKTVVFGPGSMHLMLLDLKTALKAGERAPITLLVRLRNGQEVRVTTTARIERSSPYAAAATAPHMH